MRQVAMETSDAAELIAEKVRAKYVYCLIRVNAHKNNSYIHVSIHSYMHAYVHVHMDVDIYKCMHLWVCVR
jgi:hypothetical protein